MVPKTMSIADFLIAIYELVEEKIKIIVEKRRNMILS